MTKRTGIFVWLAQHPGIVLVSGFLFASGFFIFSTVTGAWHWFPRGGALMALSGFIVSVQEALLYLSPKETVEDEYNYVAYAPVRTGPYGMPVFHPDMGITIPDPDKTQEELDQEREDALVAWDMAGEDEDNRILVKGGSPGHPGRPMRKLSELSDKEYKDLRLSAIFGVIGTIIWAFGDLFGGIPE